MLIGIISNHHNINCSNNNNNDNNNEHSHHEDNHDCDDLHMIYQISTDL